MRSIPAKNGSLLQHREDRISAHPRPLPSSIAATFCFFFILAEEMEISHRKCRAPFWGEGESVFCLLAAQGGVGPLPVHVNCCPSLGSSSNLECAHMSPLPANPGCLPTWVHVAAALGRSSFPPPPPSPPPLLLPMCFHRFAAQELWVSRSTFFPPSQFSSNEPQPSADNRTYCHYEHWGGRGRDDFLV